MRPDPPLTPARATDERRPGDLISPESAAALLCCAVNTVYRMTRQGELRSWRTGHLVFVSRSEVLRQPPDAPPPPPPRQAPPALSDRRDLLTPKQAARLLGVNVTTLYRWVLRGKLRAVKRAGSRYLIDRADALAMFQPAVPPQAE